MDEIDWDSQKRESNLAKHGIDFADLHELFEDPNLVEKVDSRRNYGETRIQVVGQARGRVLFVVYTWRGSARRMISARKATREERRDYEEKSTRA